GNTIRGGMHGMNLTGYADLTAPYTFADKGNFIGFFNYPNIIENFGTDGAANPVSYGIFAGNQHDVKIEYNNINNNNGTGVNHLYNLYGIQLLGSISTNPLISNNQIKLQSGSNNFQLQGIVNSSGTNSTVNINNNNIQFAYPNGVTPAAVGIRGINNASIPTTLNINNNIIEGITGVPIAGTSETNFIINNTTTATANVNTNNNIIRNFERTGASGTMYGIRIFANNWTANGNTIDNLKWSNVTATGETVAILNFGASTANTYTNNIINNLTTATTGAIVGIRDFFAGAKTVNGNTISNFTKVAGTADGGTFVGILLGGTTNSIFGNNIFGFTGNFINVSGILATSSAGGNTGIRENKIYDLSSTAINAIEVIGIRQDGDATAAIWNNVISGLTAPNVNSTAFTLNGISISANTPALVYYNTVLISGTSSGANFSSSAFTSGSMANLVLRNNIFINNAVPKGTGRAAAYFRNGTALTSYDAVSNNNLLAGTSIFYDGTNTDATLAAFKTRMATRDQASVSETSTPFTSTVGSSLDFLRLANGVVSVANNNALPITSPAITLDYFGVTRSTTTPDIGASEFNGLVCTAPTVYAVSGGGNGCGTTGVPVGLVNSQTGVNYQLKLNGTATGSLVAGTGTSFSFGNQTVAGTYTVDAISNVAGCTTPVAMSGSAVVTTSPAVTATISGTNVSCFGGANGTATIAASGGTPPFTYSWSPSGGTNATTTARTAGNYTCTITDAVGCSITRNITISQPTLLAFAGASQNNVACNGGSTGAASITVNGGTTPYTYLWSNGATTQSITGLVAGAYTVTVTDANSCTFTRNFTISQPASALNGTTVVINVACNGGSNGAINLTPSGGTSPYTFNWGGGITTEDRTGLAAGTYSVTITDVNGCPRTVGGITVTQPTTAVNGTTVVNNVSCNGGSNGAINLTPTGGTGPYTYVWAGGVTTEDRTGLVAGTYSVTITDSNGCTGTVSGISVTQPTTALSGTATITDVTCNGGNNGAINLTPAGGTAPYTYSWIGGITTEDRTGLVSGNYFVTITDANGCPRGLNFFVPQPTTLGGTLNRTNATCFGGNNGTLNLTPSGGTAPYTYLWADGVTTEDRTNLIAGNYSVVVTDLNGCTVTLNQIVSQPASAVSGTATITTVTCNGGNNGAINLTPTGGTGPYTYVWAGGVTTEDRTGLPAGAYSVTITDANGCTGNVTIGVFQPAAVNGTTVVNNVSCNGGSNGAINLTPTGGTGPYAYVWAGGVTTEDRTGLPAGAYSVTITDANGCTGTVIIGVFQPTVISTSVGSQTNVSCFGGATGAASVSSSGGTSPYTYAWSNGAVTSSITGLSANTYTCTVTDANFCTATRSFTITQPAAVNNAVSQALGVLTANQNGATYQWFQCPSSLLSGETNQNYTPTAAGDYKVDVTLFGCTVTSSCVTVTTLGNQSFSFNSKLSIYPNPSRDVFFINSDSRGSLVVYDLIGKIIKTENIDLGTSKLDLSNYPNGIYLMKVTNENNQTKTIKLIKQ
ncbi:T9SS type A sorting domain-containing protein, partial [Flavobacterium sp.]|uniref:T9SS type A sorting domain-containing protein n=1 Tax=Flavobacterium sp. TaxID=239 RepID=UPI00286E0480